jgi:hypothetical protein
LCVFLLLLKTMFICDEHENRTIYEDGKSQLNENKMLQHMSRKDSQSVVKNCSDQLHSRCYKL